METEATVDEGETESETAVIEAESESQTEVVEADPSGLKAKLDVAREGGLERFDGLRFRFVVRLVERADERQDARELLWDRAADRLDALRKDFDAARTECAAGLKTYDEGVPPELQAAFDSGDFQTVERALLRRPARHAARFRAQQAQKLEKQVVRRSTMPPPPAHDALAMAARLYGERSGDALTRRAVAELRDHLPSEAGPYHGTTVAADVLASLNEEARPLLRAWLQRLRNMDTLRPQAS